ncbi:MEMBRANE-ASSOCIATED KINASE REGULATOR 2 [Hibiscus trionum]|uniref:MEMBRANE-ASSOCIATED KINASE REGULATOR 2 n=1 Tax=Hibiscus trionum TaxID=183268 RepID=A0A9W7IXG0_HIBTR|nr:MEMBRANE-ASSOCIATED KINASE REGULATOR 2 [Hibiscus trionum]
MEAFSLLKYWRGGGGTNASVNTRSTATCTTTIVTAATTHLAVDTDDDEVDDGPFFDLEFAVHETEENEATVEDEGSQDSNDGIDTNSDGGCSGSETGLNFTVSNNGRSEPNSSLDSNPPQFRVSFLKSAAKVGIFWLRLKKSASNGTVSPKKQAKTKEANNRIDEKNKFFTVNLKVEEVPIMSLFSKDNSNKSHKQQTSDSSVQRYLKKVNPLYVRGKLRFSGPATPPCVAAGENQVKGSSVPTGLRVVCKHLGNNRLAAGNLSKRRDDSLLQQEDGVQSAILHCKRSFNGSRGISFKDHSIANSQ